MVTVRTSPSRDVRAVRCSSRKPGRGDRDRVLAEIDAHLDADKAGRVDAVDRDREPARSLRVMEAMEKK